MPARKYTDEQIEEALRIYREDGVAEAARQTGMNANTIASYARRKKVQTDAPAHVRAAIEMASLTRQQKREAFADVLLDQMMTTVRAIGTEMTIVPTTRIKVGSSPCRELPGAQSARITAGMWFASRMRSTWRALKLQSKTRSGGGAAPYGAFNPQQRALIAETGRCRAGPDGAEVEAGNANAAR
jgi:hypothetical protein